MKRVLNRLLGLGECEEQTRADREKLKEALQRQKEAGRKAEATIIDMLSRVSSLNQEPSPDRRG